MNKFSKGYWTHEKFMDVFIEVLRVQYVGPKYTKMKIRWWNRMQTGPAQPLWLSPQTIKVYAESYPEWSRYNPEKARGPESPQESI